MGEARQARGRPLDPRVPGCEAVELTHVGHLHLTSLEGKTILRHDLTGEEVIMQSGVSLHFEEQLAYLKFAGGDMAWANKLLAWSAWGLHGDTFCFMTYDDGFITKWADEVANVHAVDYQATDMASVRVARFKAPVPGSGCRCFWDLQDFLLRLGSGGPWATQAELVAKLSKKWESALAFRGCDSTHILRPKLGETKNGAIAGVTASTIAILTLLAVLSSKSIKASGRRASSEELLKKMIQELLPTRFVLTVLGVAPFGILSLPVHDGLVDLTGLVAALPQMLGLSRSARGAIRGPCVKPMLAKHLVLCSCRAAGFPWLAKLVQAISNQLEAGHIGMCSRRSVLERGSFADVGAYARKRDPALRSALARSSMAPINARRVTKAASKLNVSLQKAGTKSGVTLQVYEKRMECFRYWKAAHQAMSEATQLAVAVDGTRLGGRERLCGCMLTLETGAAAWMPPQAAPDKSHMSQLSCVLTWVLNVRKSFPRVPSKKAFACFLRRHF